MGSIFMRKIALILMLSLTMMVMVACGRTSSSTNGSTSSVTSSLSSTQQTRDDAALNAERLTPEQIAALVLYYRDAHMPGANDYDYSADMENNNQGATVTTRIRKKENMPTHLLIKDNPAFREASVVQVHGPVLPSL